MTWYLLTLMGLARPGYGGPHFFRCPSEGGVPHLRFHDLRHTNATLMLKSGMHPKVVSERLGHASVAFYA